MRTAESGFDTAALGRARRRVVLAILMPLSACGPALGFRNDTRDEVRVDVLDPRSIPGRLSWRIKAGGSLSLPHCWKSYDRFYMSRNESSGLDGISLKNLCAPSSCSCSITATQVAGRMSNKVR
jgi:hypothetical protein